MFHKKHGGNAKDFKEYDADDQRLEKLTKGYEELVEKLEEYTKEQVIDGYTKETIIDMLKKVLEHLQKNSKVREGVGAVMGGKILDYPAKQALNQGHAEGDRNRLVMQVKKKHKKIIIRGTSSVMADVTHWRFSCFLEKYS